MIKYYKERKNKNNVSKDTLELSDLEKLVGQKVSVYWCKTGPKRNTKNEEIENFWDRVEDELAGKTPRPILDFKTPTQVSVCGKLEQFPDDKNHFRILVDDLNYSYFDIDDIYTLVERLEYPHCICLKWN